MYTHMTYIHAIMQYSIIQQREFSKISNLKCTPGTRVDLTGTSIFNFLYHYKDMCTGYRYHVPRVHLYHHATSCVPKPKM